MEIFNGEVFFKGSKQTSKMLITSLRQKVFRYSLNKCSKCLMKSCEKNLYLALIL
jgi:hypothetical protein